ncbi:MULTISPECIES: sigma-70 family RNA polymerase sigma factor [Actinoalloteichus]|uniref:RNA polymerase sigma factor n=1 Tax=Actinoalloteichus fjordicus TaxID=1612552 RepID=A0AAC9LGB9_9PSEU|nr:MULTISPECIES: sigma-70 family RNA polymerase sigma factor [Actinoalloteichus]APU16350.1 RNA polymerase sigma-70 factor, TIGR02960 family [Actinoalloteichus fjordicus]APU22409.1 RNA polymerase sigma-70 factor, TIGR02960 family [Actinoalloteichus sp. GBA129-24]
MTSRLRQLEENSDTEGCFLREVESFRRELRAHCYRLLGSVHDAEDLVQETVLRAWRGRAGFDGRSSLRTWLYRIATRACLTALEQRGRRPLPVGLGGANADPRGPLDSRPEVPWLEPMPDALFADPAEIVTDRADVRLAFIAALQHLAPRQRAVLILRDVLCWQASEVAELLDVTTVAVNSALQRARERLARLSIAEKELVEPSAAEERATLAQYVAAFEAKDVPAVVHLLAADAVWEMPPFAAWYRGRRDVGRHLVTRCPGGPGDLRLIQTRANGSPCVALYLLDAARGDHRPFALQTLTLARVGIVHVVTFFDLRLFRTFGLPASLPAVSAESCRSAAHLPRG